MENRMPKLVQVGNSIQLGDTGINLNTDNGGVDFIKDDGYADVKVGAVTASGGISSGGNITGGGNLQVPGNITGGGSLTIDGDVNGAKNINSTGDLVTRDITCRNITSSGNTSTGDVTCNNITSSGNTSTGDITCGNITSSGDLSTGEVECGGITADGDILASGDLTAKNTDVRNLHVHGNLIVDSGHITELDVGTAVFGDKVIEIGASVNVEQGDSNGSGIRAVDHFVDMEGYTVTGIDTNTVTFSVSDDIVLNSRRIYLVTNDVIYKLNTTGATNTETLKDIADKDAVFSQEFTTSRTETEVTFKSKNNHNITEAKIEEFVGPELTYSTSENGWILNDVVITSNKIKPLVDNAGDFSFILRGNNVIRVGNSYTSGIVEDDTLITKKFADDNYLSEADVDDKFATKEYVDETFVDKKSLSSSMPYKILDINAIEPLQQDNEDGVGIRAVADYEEIQTIKQGIGTSEVEIIIPDDVAKSAKCIIISDGSNEYTADITKCQTVEEIKNLLNEDTIFTNTYTASTNENTLVISSDSNIASLGVYSYNGPTILYDKQRGGWDLGTHLISNDTLYFNGENNGDLNIVQKTGKVVKVNEGYERFITTDNTLINKRYGDLNYMSIDKVVPDLATKGVTFVDGHIKIDTENGDNRGFNIDDAFTLVLPWIQCDNKQADTHIALFGLYSEDTTTSNFIVSLYNESICISDDREGYQYFFDLGGDRVLFKPVITVDSDEQMLRVYNNGVLLGSQPFDFEGGYYRYVYFGNGEVFSEGDYENFEGLMSGECYLLNYEADEYVFTRCTTGVWAPWNEQWAQFGAQTSGVLYKGREYDLHYSTGNFAPCGIPNESGTHLCTTTGTPVWGDSSVDFSGCVAYWLFTKRLDPQVDIVDAAWGRHGQFVGSIDFNSTNLDSINLNNY